MWIAIATLLMLKLLLKLLLLLSYASQVARLFCNLFETGSASEWLLYISEWDAPGGGIPLSNIRVTTKVGFSTLASGFAFIMFCSRLL